MISRTSELPFESPNPDAKKLDANIIKQSYNATVDSCARLSLFAECGEIEEVNHEITARQNRFAVDDLIHCCISFRRLVQATNTHGLAKNALLPEVSIVPSKNGPISKIVGSYNVWNIANYVVHAGYIEFLQFEYQLRTDLSELTLMRMILEREDQRFKPLCLLTNDQGRTVNFHLFDLCRSISGSSAHIADYCAEHMIFLEDFE